MVVRLSSRAGCPVWSRAQASLPLLLRQPAAEWLHRQPPCPSSSSEGSGEAGKPCSRKMEAGPGRYLLNGGLSVPSQKSTVKVRNSSRIRSKPPPLSNLLPGLNFCGAEVHGGFLPSLPPALLMAAASWILSACPVLSPWKQNVAATESGTCSLISCVQAASQRYIILSN